MTERERLLEKLGKVKALAASPWVWRLQEADMCAAWIDEREAGQ